MYTNKHSYSQIVYNLVMNNKHVCEQNRLYEKNVAVSQHVCTGQTYSLVKCILHYIYTTQQTHITYINLHIFTYTHILLYILHYIKTHVFTHVNYLNITRIIQTKSTNISLIVIILLQCYYIVLTTTYTT